MDFLKGAGRFPIHVSASSEQKFFFAFLANIFFHWVFLTIAAMP